MKLGKHKSIVIILIFYISVCVYAYPNETIYQAYVSNEMYKWEEVLESLSSIENKTIDEQLNLLNYQYGYIAWCIGNNKHKNARIILDKAYETLNYLQKNGYNEAVLYSYKSAFIGYEIGLSIYKAPFIGMQSIEYANKAIKVDSTYYFAYVQLGNIEYYMPEIFGGSKNKAIHYYLKALALFPPDKKNNNWNYLSLLGTIIQAYIETENEERAKYYYDLAFQVEPNFHWLINDLSKKLSTLSNSS